MPRENRNFISSICLLGYDETKSSVSHLFLFLLLLLWLLPAVSRSSERHVLWIFADIDLFQTPVSFIVPSAYSSPLLPFSAP